MQHRRLKRPVRRRIQRPVTLEPLEARHMLSGLDGLQVPWIPPTDEPTAGTAPAVMPLSQRASAEPAAQIGLDSARRDFGVTGAGQTVVVIDTGIAYDHEAFGGGLGESYAVIGGWDVAEGDADPYDDGPAGFHGTHVAGIIGARDDRHPGIAPGVDLVAVRVFDDLGRGSLAWVEEALQWVEQNQNAFRYPITTVNLSLGASWNGRDFPGGGRLEDELLRLRESGVLVVAAAGNSFRTTRQPGLSYPAASPNVLPVGSVGPDGKLSDFSQRDTRIIAAPGESIESTVPDHLISRDGRPDDWLRLSGTSMAAPVVSGAAALLNEAYRTFYGAAPTPDQLIAALRDSADSINDPITSSTYAMLRVDRALAALLPSDDSGDGPADAGELGIIDGAGQRRGATERIGDRDALRVRFDAGGLFSFQVDVLTGTVDPSVRLLDANGRIVSTGGEFRVESGRDYVIEVRGDGGIGQYELQWDFTAEASTDPLVWRDGRVLIVSDGGGAADIRITLGDTLTVNVDGTESTWAASQFDTVRVAVDGGDDRVELIGTAASEELRVAGDGWSWTTPTLRVTAEGVAESVFQGGGGPADIALMWGSDGDDELTASPTEVTLRRDGRSYTVVGMDRVYVSAAGDGTDTARLVGGNGNDTLMARPEVTRLTGSGYQIHVSGFDRTDVVAGRGGTDVAWFYGVAPNDAVMRTTGATEWKGAAGVQRAEGFDRVSIFRRRSATPFRPARRTTAPNRAAGPQRTAARSRVVYGPQRPPQVSPASVVRIASHVASPGPQRDVPSTANWAEAVDRLFTREGRRPRSKRWEVERPPDDGEDHSSASDTERFSSDDASPTPWLDAALDSPFADLDHENG